MTRATLALIVVLLALAPLLLVWTFQRSLIYFPMAGVPPPEALGLANVERVSFTTDDGVTLHGWFFASPEPASATVLVCNGNAGHRAFRADLASALRANGVHVLLFDYRGYGDNAGAPTESGLASDSRAARAYLLRRPDMQARPLFYFGESLGAAVAIELAAAYPPAGLVVRSPFTSLVDMGRLHYPFLPASLLLRDRYPSIERIRGIRAPLLVVAGDQDRIIPIDDTKRLYEAAGSLEKKLVVVPGADHNDAALTHGDALLRATVTFIRAHTAS